MLRIRNLFARLAELFDRLPSQVKVIYYVVSSGLLTVLINQLSEVVVTSPYLIVLQSGCINLIQYAVIKLSEKAK